MNKKSARLRRAKSTRCKIKTNKTIRLSVHRTPRHTYAQLTSPDGKVLAVASTLEKEAKSELKFGGNVVAAKKIGELIALRGKSKGITKVAFDRSGFKYHGRVLALAESARENGLEF